MFGIGGVVTLHQEGCPSEVLISVRGSCDFELLHFHLQGLQPVCLGFQAAGRFVWVPVAPDTSVVSAHSAEEQANTNKGNAPNVHTCKFESFFGALIT